MQFRAYRDAFWCEIQLSIRQFPTGGIYTTKGVITNTIFTDNHFSLCTLHDPVKTLRMTSYNFIHFFYIMTQLNK